MTRYCTQHNNFQHKTSVTLRARERQTNLTLTGELWVSFVSYLDKNDREISGAHCTALSGLQSLDRRIISRAYSNHDTELIFVETERQGN